MFKNIFDKWDLKFDFHFWTFKDYFETNWNISFKDTATIEKS